MSESDVNKSVQPVVGGSKPREVEPTKERIAAMNKERNMGRVYDLTRILLQDEDPNTIRDHEEFAEQIVSLAEAIHLRIFGVV